MKIFIKRSQSFPSFHTVRNDLELEEIELDHSMTQGQAFAFYSAPSGAGHPSQQLLPPRPAGTAISSSGPSPSCPQPQQRRQRKGEGEGEMQEQ
jgi:hypothetical protein